MKASLRWTTNLLAGGLMLAPVVALAQTTTPPQTTGQQTSSPDAVGPSELQNFSLKGSVTKPADQPPSAPSSEIPARAPSELASGQTTQTRENQTPSMRPPKRAEALVRPAGQKDQASAVPLTAPRPMRASSDPVAAPAPQPSFSQLSLPASPPAAPSLAPEHKLTILPWLVAALVLGLGLLFLLWRRRQQVEAYAGAPGVDMFVPPEPVPARVPAPGPRPAPRAATPGGAPVPPAAPTRRGIVSSRLRPALQISARPLRCLIERERVVIEFELELYNSGTAPARAVLAEASIFNAGANQEQELGAFFANPVGAGERLALIEPMKRMAFAHRVEAPRSAIHEYELGGKKALVPLLAFNALYEWSGGHAQTSAAFLVGRETNGDKLAPLGVEPTPRDYRALGARLLPTELRT